MTDLLIYLLIACGNPVISNSSDLPWNDHDQGVFERNRTFCSKKFKESICMKRFVKIEFQTYRIYCGKP